MAKAAKGKKKGSFWKKALIILGVSLLVLIVIAVILLANLFGKPPRYAVEPLQPEDYVLQGKIAGKLIQEMFREVPPEEATLILNPVEIRSLIRFADNGITLESMLSGKGGTASVKNHNMRYENGRFEIQAPVETEYTWLWGGVIVTDMSVRPEKDADSLSLDITGFRAGAYRVPDWITARVTTKIVADFRSKKDYVTFDRCVKSIRIDGDNNLVLVYRPREIARQFMPENLQRQLQNLQKLRSRR